MCVVEFSVLIETAAHYRCKQHRMPAFGPHISDKPRQGLSVIFRRRISLAFVFRGIVMPELDKNVVALPQIVDDRLPLALGDVRLCTPPICCPIFYPDLPVFDM